MKYLDLATLTDRTGLEPRKLRYCVDHELVPEHTWHIAENEHGRPRQFDEVTAVLFVCSALLLQAGIRRDAVKWLMGHITGYQKPKPNSLNLSLVSYNIQNLKPLTVMAADASHCRWTTPDLDSGWIDVRAGFKRDPRFQPFVTITIDVMAIAKSVLS
jgi:hypothetical protein